MIKDIHSYRKKEKKKEEKTLGSIKKYIYIVTWVFHFSSTLE